MHTHYDNLKVARNAPQAVIKAAYRALSQQYHPDRNPHPDASRVMKILNDAWAVLGESDTRAAYDRKLAAKDARSATAAAQASQDAPIGAKADQVNNATAAAMRRSFEQTTTPKKARSNVGKAYVVGSIVFVIFAALFVQVILYLAG